MGFPLGQGRRNGEISGEDNKQSWWFRLWQKTVFENHPLQPGQDYKQGVPKSLLGAEEQDFPCFGGHEGWEADIKLTHFLKLENV